MQDLCRHGTSFRASQRDINDPRGVLSRNKFCFTGGYIETSVQLPGFNNVLGFWPAVWAMGNLGRAGYGASLEGIVRPQSMLFLSRSFFGSPFPHLHFLFTHRSTLISLFDFCLKWPYTYDTCDVGTVSNQTVNGQPVEATINGDHKHGGALSYLPGQRLSRCTCNGEDHPGPKHSDGSFVGRSAPEIDIFEAQVSGDFY
jgi:beta-glucanase (GH16 family)